MNKHHYFSTQSKAYAAFRPKYPEALYEFIFKHLNARSCAWDCATGNGQVAGYLARHFDRVHATDVSQQQLDNAIAGEKIVYSLSPAEHTDFPNNYFDLVTVGQALHWFDLDLFYAEVNRTCRTGALLAVWGYALLTVDPVIDKLFLDFYLNTVGPYWDEARKLVENRYRDIHFPFEEIPSPEFAIEVNWNAEQFMGYLSTWSATQKYIQVKGEDPVASFSERLRTVWKHGDVKPVSFPVFMKLGRVAHA